MLLSFQSLVVVLYYKKLNLLNPLPEDCGGRDKKVKNPDYEEQETFFNLSFKKMFFSTLPERPKQYIKGSKGGDYRSGKSLYEIRELDYFKGFFLYKSLTLLQTT